MENEVKENLNSTNQSVGASNNKSYKTHFIVTLIILIGLIVYMTFFSNGIRNLEKSSKRPVPETSTGEIKTTIITKDNEKIEVTSTKDENGNEKIEASTTITDGNMSINFNSYAKEGEENVQVNIE